jgi:hypothetical protein
VTDVSDRLRSALADRYRLERELGRGASPTHLPASCLCKLSVPTPLLVVLAAAGVALAQPMIAQAPEPVDLVLHNGKVVTLDDHDRVTSASLATARLRAGNTMSHEWTPRVTELGTTVDYRRQSPVAEVPQR